MNEIHKTSRNLEFNVDIHDELPDLMETLDNFAINSSSDSSPSPPTKSTKDAAGRQLRNRSVNSQLENTLHKVKRRTIAKPRKLNAATLSSDASEKLIKKLYLNKKLTKLKPTNLETIFETPKEDKNKSIVFISATRFKRSLDFKNYHTGISKQIIQKRRQRIKKFLGSAPKVKKITMDQFLDRFKSLQEENDNLLVE